MTDEPQQEPLPESTVQVDSGQPEDALVIRDWVADTIRPDPPLDRMGHQQPRRLGMYGFLRAIPGLVAQFMEIPGEFWAQDMSGDGFSVAVIACPCGEEPRVEVGLLEVCGCQRAFMFAGTKVYVANSPLRAEPPRWQQIARQWGAQRRS